MWYNDLQGGPSLGFSVLYLEMGGLENVGHMMFGYKTEIPGGSSIALFPLNSTVFELSTKNRNRDHPVCIFFYSSQELCVDDKRSGLFVCSVVINLSDYKACFSPLSTTMVSDDFISLGFTFYW